MDTAPLFNLVRTADIRSTGRDIDLSGSSPIGVRHDEIELVDADGYPSAFPVPMAPTDIDWQQRLSNGALNRIPRGHLQNVHFNIDYITNAVRQKLLQWESERALVHIAPGWGSSSAFAVRPLYGMYGSVYQDGVTNAYDLTGLVPLSALDLDSWWWDDIMHEGVPRGVFSNKSPVVLTPAGSGLITNRRMINRMDPAYPESATAGVGPGTCGWNRWGTHASTINLSLVSNGFGHSACPPSLRVHTTAAGAVRALGIQSAWTVGDPDFLGYQFTGAGVGTATVWLKGRVGGTDPYIEFGQTGIGSDRINLQAFNEAEWTPITMRYYATDWTLATPTLKLNFPSDPYNNESEFEIGPIAVYQDSGAQRMPTKIWTPDASTAPQSGPGSVSALSAIRYPATGSMMYSFWCPEDYFDRASYDHGYSHLCGTAGFGLSIDHWLGYPTAVLRMNPDLTANITGKIKRGANSICVTWDTTRLRLYFNGHQVAERTGTNGQSFFESYNWTPTFGGQTSYLAGACPFISLTMRVDHQEWSAIKTMGIHRQLTDDGALGVVVPARGRTFEITSIPNKARATARGTQWLGGLGLRQVSYDPNLADLAGLEVLR